MTDESAHKDERHLSNPERSRGESLSVIESRNIIVNQKKKTMQKEHRLKLCIFYLHSSCVIRAPSLLSK